LLRHRCCMTATGTGWRRLPGRRPCLGAGEMPGVVQTGRLPRQFILADGGWDRMPPVGGRAERVMAGDLGPHRRADVVVVDGSAEKRAQPITWPARERRASAALFRPRANSRPVPPRCCASSCTLARTSRWRYWARTSLTATPVRLVGRGRVRHRGDRRAGVPATATTAASSAPCRAVPEPELLAHTCWVLALLT
jgi:hypothetical protein